MNTCILIGTVAWLHLTNGSGTELYINVDVINSHAGNSFAF